jgi:hypothetical protein
MCFSRVTFEKNNYLQKITLMIVLSEIGDLTLDIVRKILIAGL